MSRKIAKDSVTSKSENSPRIRAHAHSAARSIETAPTLWRNFGLGETTSHKQRATTARVGAVQQACSFPGSHGNHLSVMMGFFRKSQTEDELGNAAALAVAAANGAAPAAEDAKKGRRKSREARPSKEEMEQQEKARKAEEDAAKKKEEADALRKQMAQRAAVMERRRSDLDAAAAAAFEATGEAAGPKRVNRTADVSSAEKDAINQAIAKKKEAARAREEEKKKAAEEETRKKEEEDGENGTPEGDNGIDGLMSAIAFASRPKPTKTVNIADKVAARSAATTAGGIFLSWEENKQREERITSLQKKIASLQEIVNKKQGAAPVGRVRRMSNAALSLVGAKAPNGDIKPEEAVKAPAKARRGSRSSAPAAPPSSTLFTTAAEGKDDSLHNGSSNGSPGNKRKPSPTKGRRRSVANMIFGTAPLVQPPIAPPKPAQGAEGELAA